MKRAIRHCNGARVLDIGCGEGADSAFFARRGFKVTSIDKNTQQLDRFRSYRRDSGLGAITILNKDALTFGYPRNTYDVVICVLVLCCMKRSEFDTLLPAIKRSLKPGGTLVVSSRNYLDPEVKDYRKQRRMIEPNTYPHVEDCCKYVYFIEKNRLRELFHDFQTLYYFEGSAPCKYNEHPRHGDSYIICRKPK